MTSMRCQVHVRRVYDDVEGGGARVLVDRLWPRGLSKQAADLTSWPKQVAPSDGLRRWYGHEPDRFGEFAERYRQELDDDEHGDALSEIVTLAEQRGVILLTATKDVDRSHAAVLAEVVRARL